MLPGLMIQFPKFLIKGSLFFCIGTSLGFGIFSVMTGHLIQALFGFFSFSLALSYTKISWKRISFASANLATALTALRDNMGLFTMAYCVLLLAFAWGTFWAISAAGAMVAISPYILFLFVPSYFWVDKVLKNIVHVTSAGVIGSWWFTPLDGSSCFSPIIGEYFMRASTYSFGSICFGSLLVSFVQGLRSLFNIVKPKEDRPVCDTLSCCLEFILDCFDGMLDEMNKWAYIYIGLYGYDFVDAGGNALMLFESKGWKNVIVDDLCDNVLAMTNITIGLATGCVGMLMASVYEVKIEEMGYMDPQLPGFL
jgi:hypothetical protein